MQSVEKEFLFFHVSVIYPINTKVASTLTQFLTLRQPKQIA